MILYSYEAQILRYLNKVFPKLKEATYAKQDLMFTAMSAVKKFPVFMYFREPTDWTNNREYQIIDENSVPQRFVAYNQQYFGRIYFESELEVQNAASLLRFYWNTHAYLDVTYNDNPIKIGLRLLYIKIDVDREANDKKGSQRYVEFSWSSSLFMSNDNSVALPLVEKFNIYLNTSTNEVLFMDESNLIATIK